MQIKRLYLSGFRRFDELDLSLRPGITLIEGLNGQGKTSILEALYLLSAGSSFRTPSLKELAQESRSSFFVEGEYLRDDASSSISLSFDGEKRRVSLSGIVQEKASALFGNLLVIVSTPDDLEFVYGSPQVRRRELDLLNCQYIPSYATLLSRYERTLQQRNKLLKLQSFETISAWEDELAEYGASIMLQREELFKNLQSRFKNELGSFIESSDWDMEYIPSVQGYSYEKLKTMYQDRRDQEVRAGCTLYGPHRDDILLKFKKYPAKSRASLGQAKCALLALRLAAWDLLKERSKTEPLFLLDDLESFLDPEKRRNLLVRLESIEQVIISTASRGESRYIQISV